MSILKLKKTSPYDAIATDIRKMYFEEHLRCYEISDLLAQSGVETSKTRAVRRATLQRWMAKHGLKRANRCEAGRRRWENGSLTQTATKICDHCRNAYTLHKSGLGIFRSRWCSECRGPDGVATQILKLYDMSWQEYQALKAISQGRCGVCSVELEPLKAKNYRLVHIDHDHATGRVRGIVCHRCNQRLAAIDDSDWLEKAQIYIKRTSGASS